METQNIFWGLVAGVGVIVAAIGVMWVWLPMTLSVGAVWTIVAGCMLAVLGAARIVE